jgi:hypothetical protein
LGYKETRLDKAAFQRGIREDATPPLTAQEELVEPSTYGSPQLFRNKDMCEYWLTVKNECPVVAELTIPLLLPFAAYCLYESAFSALT